MIILPMAGLSRRFFDAGYDQAKYRLPLAGRPVFDWAVLSFERCFETDEIIVVFRQDRDTSAFVEERMRACGVRDWRAVELPGETRGQAETVAMAVDALSVEQSEPLTIFNVDTLRPGYRPPEPGSALGNAAGFLEVFRGDGDHWSFVEAAGGPDPIALRVVEKVRISDLCCNGLYHFSSRASFDRALEEERRRPSAAELYVAPLFQHLIRDGLEVRYRYVDEDQMFFSGTPAEYQELGARAGDVLRAYGSFL